MYDYKPNFSKSVILSISDLVLDEGRDLLEDILPNKMIRKLKRQNVGNILDTFP